MVVLNQKANVRDLYQRDDPWVCMKRPYQPRGSALIDAPYIRAMRKLKAIDYSPCGIQMPNLSQHAW